MADEPAPDDYLSLEKYELLRDVVDKSDSEVHLHVASSVLCADLPKTAAEIGEVMPDGEMPELVGPWQRAVASYKAGAGKGEGSKFSLDLTIVPVSHRRHGQLARIVVTNIPGDGKTTEPDQKIHLEVFASNYGSGRRQSFKGPEIGGEAITFDARICHRLVRFSVEWPAERKVSVFLLDKGQVTASCCGLAAEPSELTTSVPKRPSPEQSQQRSQVQRASSARGTVGNRVRRCATFAGPLRFAAAPIAVGEASDDAGAGA
jgi:hypothetical protein